MFIIFGRRVINLKVGTGKFYCPHCESVQPFKHFRRTRFFTLYFIPVMPLDTIDQRVECQRCGMEYNTNVLRHQVDGFVYEAKNPVLNTALIVVAVAVVLLVLTAISTAVSNNQVTQQNAAIAATNQAFSDTYGQSNMALCQSGGDNAATSFPANSHLIVVDYNTSSLLTAYQQFIPAAKQAHNQTDLTHVICVSGKNEVYDTDRYGDPNTRTTVYTCTRYRYVAQVWAIDIKSHHTNKAQQVRGPLPAECPEQTSDNLEYYGDPPAPAQVIAILDLR